MNLNHYIISKKELQQCRSIMLRSAASAAARAGGKPKNGLLHKKAMGIQYKYTIALPGAKHPRGGNGQLFYEITMPELRSI